MGTCDDRKRQLALLCNVKQKAVQHTIQPVGPVPGIYSVLVIQVFFLNLFPHL